MTQFYDYESMGRYQVLQEAVPLYEAYAGTDIVSWYGSIERQLIGLETDYKNLKNQEYADKIHTFLQTWRDNPITGSMNIETLELLMNAAAQNAIDPWKLANYFSNLRDQLRKLIAAQEELPIDTQPQPGARRKSPTPRGPSDFGPNASAPGEAPAPSGGAAPPV
jgi:hypothetical protein